VVNDGRGLRIAHLVGVALVVGGLSWMGWRLYLNAGNLLPPVSWVSSILLVLMAVLVLSAGLPVRRFLRGEATKPLSPIRAARTLVLAQAAALTGAGVFGYYAGQLVLVVPELDIVSYQGLLWRLGAIIVGGLLLAAAGLATQRMCRIDRGDRDRDRNERDDRDDRDRERRDRERRDDRRS
jgi:Protein of unknown function (DUF3180)